MKSTASQTWNVRQRKIFSLYDMKLKSAGKYFVHLRMSRLLILLCCLHRVGKNRFVSIVHCQCLYELQLSWIFRGIFFTIMTQVQSLSTGSFASARSFREQDSSFNLLRSFNHKHPFLNLIYATLIANWVVCLIMNPTIIVFASFSSTLYSH